MVACTQKGNIPTTFDVGKLYVILKKETSRECRRDDDTFCPREYSGNNFESAYHVGNEDGKVLFARELLKEFFPK